jgi:hypothetical protein
MELLGEGFKNRIPLPTPYISKNPGFFVSKNRDARPEKMGPALLSVAPVRHIYSGI